MPEQHVSDRFAPPTRVQVQGEPVDTYPDLAPESQRGRALPITVVGEEVLHRPNADVTEFATSDLDTLINDMFHTMYVAEGVGLAANQVGVDLRLFVYDCRDDDGVRHVGHILNPVLEERDPQTPLLVENEGCLSVPGPHAELPRAEHATVHGLDKTGQPLRLTGSGYFARCLQHETDHTLGRLYIDRLPKRERKKVLKEMAEMREDVFARRATVAAQLAGETTGQDHPDSTAPPA
ncbi:peptide deformylase [Salinactinospora qingdaonensis]|uniref:Peptide deformylase n=1 Tax=Salinactinospora qingdaonensis TaxID=702744 RepID=A0ABP7G3U1_9ACTN